MPKSWRKNCGIVSKRLRELSQANNEGAAFVYLIFTFKFSQPAMPRIYVERFVYHRRNLLELGPNERLGYMMEKARIAKARIVSKLFSSNGRVHARPEDIYWAKVREANIQAMRSYEPKAYSGSITLFLPSELPDTSSPDRRMAWRELATGGMEVHLVPGDHNTMIKEPHARVLAEKLHDCLQKAQTTQRGPAPRLN